LNLKSTSSTLENEALLKIIAKREDQVSKLTLENQGHTKQLDEKESTNEALALDNTTMTLANKGLVNEQVKKEATLAYLILANKDLAAQSAEKDTRCLALDKEVHGGKTDLRVMAEKTYVAIAESNASLLTERQDNTALKTKLLHTEEHVEMLTV
jgi:hypothetical protein